MRCNAWSSRAIWVSSAALAAAALAPGALAQVSISPDEVQTGELAVVTLSVPNLDDGLPLNHVTVGIPQDFSLADAEAKGGWAESRTGQAVTWSGGSIPKGEFATFSVRGRSPKHVETVLFNVVVGDRKGTTATSQVALAVAAHWPPAVASDRLGRTALIVAIVAGVLALVALGFGLAAWRSRRRTLL